MKIDINYAKALSAYADLGVALQQCRHADSEDGVKISANEFKNEILPLHHKAENAIRELYKEIIMEHSKDNEVLMAKCLTCSKYNNVDCKLYNGLTDIKWDDFQVYIEKNSAVCVEGADNEFYVPEGELPKHLQGH